MNLLNLICVRAKQRVHQLFWKINIFCNYHKLVFLVISQTISSSTPSMPPLSLFASTSSTGRCLSKSSHTSLTVRQIAVSERAVSVFRIIKFICALFNQLLTVSNHLRTHLSWLACNICKIFNYVFNNQFAIFQVYKLLYYSWTLKSYIITLLRYDNNYIHPTKTVGVQTFENAYVIWKEIRSAGNEATHRISGVFMNWYPPKSWGYLKARKKYRWPTNIPMISMTPLKQKTDPIKLEKNDHVALQFCQMHIK